MQLPCIIHLRFWCTQTSMSQYSSGSQNSIIHRKSLCLSLCGIYLHTNEFVRSWIIDVEFSIITNLHFSSAAVDNVTEDTELYPVTYKMSEKCLHLVKYRPLIILVRVHYATTFVYIAIIRECFTLSPPMAVPLNNAHQLLYRQAILCVLISIIV